MNFGQERCDTIVFLGNVNEQYLEHVRNTYLPQNVLVFGGSESSFRAIENSFSCDVVRVHEELGVGQRVQQWNIYSVERFSGPIELPESVSSKICKVSTINKKCLTVTDFLNRCDFFGHANVLVSSNPNQVSFLLASRNIRSALKSNFQRFHLVCLDESILPKKCDRLSDVLCGFKDSGFEVDVKPFRLKGLECSVTLERSRALTELEDLKQKISKLVMYLQERGEIELAASIENYDSKSLIGILEAHISTLHSTGNKIEGLVKKASANTVKQLESFHGVRDFLRNESISLNFHGWPISSDIALHMLRLIKQEKFDYIIEFGSGTSSVLFGKAVKEIKGHVLETPSVLSFEHSLKYQSSTEKLLEEFGVSDAVKVEHAPLIPWSDGKREFYHYDCDRKLAQVRERLSGHKAKVLIFIDGPPGATCPMARYPAVPKVLEFLSNHELHILMDDYVREDEKRAARQWSNLFKRMNIPFKASVLNFEKAGFSWILNQNE